MTGELTGGCQCGRIRYRIACEGAQAYLCHCRMCQRATGGFAAALVEVTAGGLEWETEPEWFASSPIARRPFCAHCGTPLGFSYTDGTGQDVTLGSLDDPNGFVPVAHFGTEHLNPAWIALEHLPWHRTGEVGSIGKRWKDAGLDIPE
ncbi:MAG: GFA family protein [Sphingomonadaceae bacterium]